MSLSGKKTLPMLSGVLSLPSAWGALTAQSGFRLYPFQLGATVRADSTGTSVLTNGLGEFRQNDYLLACRGVDYGGSYLYIPDVTRIARVTSDPSAATDDTLTISPGLALISGEFLLNLGADGAAVPTSAPSYDGSRITIYEDNAGNNPSAYDYVLSGQHGGFRGWLSEGTILADLLITDPSGAPKLVWPFYAINPEVI